MQTTMVDKSQELAERKTNVLAAIGVGFVCLVVGVPLWWKSTEVYRVSLPYSHIDTLAEAKAQSNRKIFNVQHSIGDSQIVEIAYFDNDKIRYTVDINVVSFLESVSQSELAALSRHLSDQLEDKNAEDVKSHYRTFTREASDKEKQILASSSSLSDLDTKIAGYLPSKANEYTVIVLPGNSGVKVKTPTLGLHRVLYLSTSSTDMGAIAANTVGIVKSSLIREATIMKGFNTARGARNLKPDKEMLRSVRFHTGYDVTLTLVNPRPDILDVQWDVTSAVDGYLDPLVKRMANFTNINIKSQVLFFTRLQTKPRKDGDEFYFTIKHLPHMINPLEAKLGSPASTNPELNFVVYVPSRGQYPLHIRDENDEKLAINSFLSPQWGGIHIYNIAPPPENASLPMETSVDMAEVMQVFLFQLRLLLNLHDQVSNDVDFLPIGREAVTDWELDSWLRSRCVENLATSSATLKSLAQLLGKISNIVINDDIGNEVHKAVASMQEALQMLSDGYLLEAYQHSKSAIQASEKAFFDPSLLELLYFPEDQKFAIYIPLFLPISFPVISSLWQSYKWYKGLSKPKQD